MKCLILSKIWQFLEKRSRLPHPPLQLLLARWSQKIPSNIICTLHDDRHPAVHLFHSYKFCSVSWNTYHHFQWHSLLDELEQTASQSIKNWVSSYLGTKQQRPQISQQWYHPFPTSTSARNLNCLHLWSDMFFSDQINSVSKTCHFSYPRHLSNSSSSSSFYSHSSCKFTCLQKTLYVLQFTLLWHLTNKSEQTSTHSKFEHWHVSLQTLVSKYQHITPTLKKLHWLNSYQTKNRLQNICLLTYKTLTNQQPTYISTI